MEKNWGKILFQMYDKYIIWPLIIGVAAGALGYIMGLSDKM